MEERIEKENFTNHELSGFGYAEIAEYLKTHEQDEELCEQCVTYDGRLLKYIHHQTLDLCTKAVITTPIAIRYVEEQYIPLVISTAIYYSNEPLRYVRYQSDRMCLDCVKKNGLALKYVENQSVDICKTAVKQNGLALQYVKYCREDIDVLAVRQNGDALQYVKLQNGRVCVEAMKQTPHAILYVRTITPSVVFTAGKILFKFLGKKFSNGIEKIKTVYGEVKGSFSDRHLYHDEDMDIFKKDNHTDIAA